MIETTKLTRQGVKDLNPRAVNGKRPTCPHFRDPQAVAVERRKEDRYVERDGVYETVALNVYYCLGCGVERYTE